VVEESAMALEHAHNIRDIQDTAQCPDNLKSHKDMTSSNKQGIAESKRIRSSGASMDSLHPTLPQPGKSTIILSNKLHCILSQLPPPPIVVIPATFRGLLAQPEGAITHQLSENRPAINRLVFQAKCDQPSQIPVEEDNYDSVPLDDNNDSNYLKDIKSAEVLGPEEQLPPSKRRK
jgi:hypothetical protein